MSRRDWWLGVIVLTAAILTHALVPRYEWSAPASGAVLRMDRWLGRVEVVSLRPPDASR